MRERESSKEDVVIWTCHLFFSQEGAATPFRSWMVGSLRAAPESPSLTAPGSSSSSGTARRLP